MTDWSAWDTPALWALVSAEGTPEAWAQVAAWDQIAGVVHEQRARLARARDALADVWHGGSAEAFLRHLDDLVERMESASRDAAATAAGLGRILDGLGEARQRIEPLQARYAEVRGDWMPAVVDHAEQELDGAARAAMAAAEEAVRAGAEALRVPTGHDAPLPAGPTLAGGDVPAQHASGTVPDGLSAVGGRAVEPGAPVPGAGMPRTGQPSRSGPPSPSSALGRRSSPSSALGRRPSPSSTLGRRPSPDRVPWPAARSAPPLRPAFPGLPAPPGPAAPATPGPAAARPVEEGAARGPSGVGPSSGSGHSPSGVGSSAGTGHSPPGVGSSSGSGHHSPSGGGSGTRSSPGAGLGPPGPGSGATPPTGNGHAGWGLRYAEPGPMSAVGGHAAASPPPAGRRSRAPDLDERRLRPGLLPDGDRVDRGRDYAWRNRTGVDAVITAPMHGPQVHDPGLHVIGSRA